MNKSIQLVFVRIVLFITISFFPTAILRAVNPQSMGTLPSQLVESSGLDFTGTTGFWTHNDGYGDNKLYQLNNTGSLLKTLTIQGAVNNDWEDVTHDANRSRLFIGDFGNNACGRTNLHVYIIPYPSGISGNSVSAQCINFTYPDQTQFPSPWMNFDAEAFVHLNGHLYIFSKGAGNAIGYTKMYSLPDAPGTYVATLVDSFYINDRVTSADLSPDGTALVLLCYGHIHLFRNFSGANFFEGQHTLLSIGGTWTQKEAIAFTDNQNVYLTDENSGSGNYLYYMDLSAWLPAQSTGLAGIQNEGTFAAYPNPARGYFTIEFGNSARQNVSIQLFDLTGKLVRETHRENPVAAVRMETADLPSGVYFYKLLADNRELHTARLLISH